MNNINTATTVKYFNILLERMSGDFTRDTPLLCPVRTASEAASILWQHTEWGPEVICSALSAVRWPGEEGWENFHPPSEGFIDDRLAVVVINPKASHRGLFLEGSCRVFGGMNTIPPGEDWKAFQEQAQKSALALARHRNVGVKDPLPGDPEDWAAWLLVPYQV